MIIPEFIEIAKTKGDGWVEYMWPKPRKCKNPKTSGFSPGKQVMSFEFQGKTCLRWRGYMNEETLMGWFSNH